MSNHIALIEDDTMLAELTQSFLEQHGLKISLFNNAKDFLARTNYEDVDIIICDINMPEMSGFELCEIVRKRYLGPFIFLSARKADTDLIKGLELGADDFISKPVKPQVLLAKIQASLRATNRKISEIEATITLEKLSIDPQERLLKVNENLIQLTTDEFDLLWVLIKYKGQSLSRDKLFQLVVGKDYDGQDRVIDGRISRLRKKFNSINGNLYEIKTIWRKGYAFCARDSDNS